MNRFLAGIRRPLAALAVAAMLISAPAAGKEVETTAVGTGSDENAALADALAKAVAQVKGVRSAMDVSTGKLEIAGSAKSTGPEGTTESQARVEVGRSADARMRAQGSVSRYEVLKTEPLDGGKVRVTVKAYVSRHEAPVYKAPGSAGSKQRVAVFPSVATAPSYDFYGAIDGDAMASELTARLESAFMGTGQVSVLDRRTLGASLVELGLVGSSLTNAEEKAKLKQLRGADVIVMATVHEAYRRVHYWRLQSTGQERSSEDLAFDVEVRAVVPATAELLVSKRVRLQDAMGREDALAQVADLATYEVVRALTGVAPPMPVRAVPAGAHERREPAGPRRSGIRLPGDR